MEEIVSIIVPVYNVAPYLERCVQSIRQQTYPHYQLILVDDCSTDDSRGVMERCAGADPRITLVYQPANQGVSAARNAGIRQARGQWLAFCDGDDWYSPDFLEKMLSAARREQAQCVICDYYIASDGQPPLRAGSTRAIAQAASRETLVALGPISSCTHLIKTDLFRENGLLYPEGCAQYEELAVIPPAVGLARRTAVLEEALYYYYQRGNGTSASNHSSNCRENFQRAYGAMCEKLGEGYGEEKAYHAIYALLYGETLNLCKKRASGTQIRQAIADFKKEYPDYGRNRYVKRMGLAKRAYIACASCGCLPALRLMAAIHGKIVH